MGTLVVDRKDCRLELDGQALVLRVPGEPVRHVPSALLERVVLHAGVIMDTRVVGHLAERGVGMLILDGRRAQRMATLVGVPHRDVRLRIAQVRRLDDPQFADAWCRRVVDAKLRSQHRLLRQAARQRPDLRRPLRSAMTTIDQCRRRLDGTRGPDGLRGLEGAAAAAYFRGFAALFPPSLGFHARKRRPPPDPVNACLSLGYTLLHGMAVQACHQQGLDPMVGYLHAPLHGRASLACDLMEPWRTQVDALVWRLFRERILTADSFGNDGSGACLLGKAGRRHFHGHWAQHAAALQRAMRRHARLAPRALGESDGSDTRGAGIGSPP